MTPDLSSRRRFIALVGGGAVLAAAPLAGCSSSPYPAAAVGAWEPVAADVELRRWMLATSDAHGVYGRLGWAQVTDPAPFMQRHFPDVYK